MSESPRSITRTWVCCPTCGRDYSFRSADDIPTFPFCSKECQYADLDKWFEGDCRISEPLEPSGERSSSEEKPLAHE